MADSRDSRRPRFTRREALGLIGAGAAAVLSRGLAVSAQEPRFPREAVIRTVLRDFSPSELAGGTTLFHEHLTHAPDWNTRKLRQAGVREEVLHGILVNNSRRFLSFVPTIARTA